MYEQRSDRPVEYERSASMADVTSMPRSGLVPAWITRISWGSVFAGVFVAAAIALTLSALAVWANFGLAKITTVASIKSEATTAAVWVGISALIALFVGGIVASRLSNSLSVGSGLWHGFVTWGVGLVAFMVMSVAGFSGVLGFGVTGRSLLRILPETTTGITLTRATGASATYAGWFVAFAVLGLGASLIGGWLGSYGIGRRAAMKTTAITTETEEPRARRAA